MKIIVLPNDEDVTDELIDKSSVVVTIDSDRKGFLIDRQVALSNTRLFMKIKGHHRHMSELKHILLAEKK